ncbi:methylated-DNA--[protein]-cysteine S-methyltransferase [Elusimicrobium simillimum]|uniref:methylated-DNA--[protein]-cysteine S-methyltransferase n=1 Tax=Elusimicrobium simillimum TaxID=3143438 RepID=UPI003C6EF95A
MFYTMDYSSPIGALLMASDGKNITGLWMKGQKYYAATLPAGAVKNADLPVFKTAAKWLDKYFAGKNPPLSDLRLAPKGSDFRAEVWKILCEIPYGKVITYGDIAKKIAKKSGKKTMSGQAVGGAVGHNPISIIIPCHRVVGANGSLTGFAGGVGKKVKLLGLEGVDMSGLTVPKKGTAV